jgi:hypothetical protein
MEGANRCLSASDEVRRRNAIKQKVLVCFAAHISSHVAGEHGFVATIPKVAYDDALLADVAARIGSTAEMGRKESLGKHGRF